MASEPGVPPDLDGSGLRIGLVCGRFNERITSRLVAGARRGLAQLGVAEPDVTEVWVPGAFEIPMAVKLLIGAGQVDAVIGLGAVIRGETTHYDIVAGESAAGVQRVQLDTGVPVIFGVLTTENVGQAESRSEGPGGRNIGEEAAATAVEMARLAQRWRQP